MRELKEHNNRIIAKKNAEYITGQELRLYLAEKVKKYLGEDPITVFDGAVGSGQLEQHINISKLYGLDIQEMAVNTAKENYENSDIECKSFFEYDRNDFIADCVIMNPPFSIPFKQLSEIEQENIKSEFSWKKSGKVDDVFILKSLKYTKRYGFYIAFPGIGYRRDEAKMRELIGNQLVELNMIENAFTDTSISVIFLVIDKEKTADEVYSELYDCKSNEIKASTTIKLENGRWEYAREEEKKEVIDIEEVQEKLFNSLSTNIVNHFKVKQVLKEIRPQPIKDELRALYIIIKRLMIEEGIGDEI